MNQQQAEKRWQELELRIHQMFAGVLKSDVPAIEHKPRHIGLLQMPADNIQRENVKTIP